MSAPERVSDDRLRELFLAPTGTVTETSATVALRFEVVRARKVETEMEAAIVQLKTLLRECVRIGIGVARSDILPSDRDRVRASALAAGREKEEKNG